MTGIVTDLPVLDYVSENSTYFSPERFGFVSRFALKRCAFIKFAVPKKLNAWNKALRKELIFLQIAKKLPEFLEPEVSLPR